MLQNSNIEAAMAGGNTNDLDSKSVCNIATSDSQPNVTTSEPSQSIGLYRTYKRRWFGLIQVCLMNIIISWGWLTYAPVAPYAAIYYSVSESYLNWIAISFFIAFIAISPLSLAALQHHNGLRISLSAAALLLLVGNWIRYAGATSKNDLGGSNNNGHIYAMAGEILIGFAQPLVLAAPTRYSDLWFTSRGRVGATALMSLSNPLGGILGQLVNPFWVKKPGDISNMLLYISIISTVAAIPSFFIPSRPPTPVGPASETPKLRLQASFRALASLEIWLILIPFWVYVGSFNAISSLLNQMLIPYGFTNIQAGIGGAILIVVGLVVAGIASPIIDRTKAFLLSIKIFIPVVALSFLAWLFMPETQSLPGAYVVLAVMGGAAFSLLPVTLEFLLELSHPLNPAVTSTFAWVGGQFFGAVFILIMDALIAPDTAVPPRNCKNSLIFLAAVAMAAAPLALSIGLFGRKDKVILKRMISDAGVTS